MNTNQPITKKDLIVFGKKLEKKIETKLETKLEAKLESKFNQKFKQLENDLDTKLEAKLESKLETKLEQKFNQKFNKFYDDLALWKSQIFNLVDGLAIEVRDSRDHRQITSHQISSNTQRISKLEQKVFGSISSQNIHPSSTSYIFCYLQSLFTLLPLLPC